MGKINKANMKKTLYYLNRNGLKNTWDAVRERMDDKGSEPYSYVPLEEKDLEYQRRDSMMYRSRFSIVVPAYKTNRRYLRDLIASVAEQTYSKWELIIADATEDLSVERALWTIADEMDVPIYFAKATDDTSGLTWQNFRIRYVRLEKNEGIAENTNLALPFACGDYIGLLDHDDVLTANALYEMALAIDDKVEHGVDVKLLYSDEDKCNKDRTQYYEPHYKEKFNLDLLLSNNYICHFLVMDASMMKELRLREAYNGAQDYDLVLRAAGRLMNNEEQIVHIPKVLYHWRCHTASTAENPQSKQYAYDAGMRALQDFADSMNWKAKATALKHVGFYVLWYKGGPLKERQDVGAVGGRIVSGPKQITECGRMSEMGEVYYKGLPVSYSGYMHRASLTQDAEALDIRCIQVKEELHVLFKEVAGVPYKKIPGTEYFDASVLPKGTDYVSLSLKLSRVIRSRGYRLLYLPERIEKWDSAKRRIKIPEKEDEE